MNVNSSIQLTRREANVYLSAHMCDKIPLNALIPLVLLNKTSTPPKTATSQTTTDNDRQN